MKDINEINHEFIKNLRNEYVPQHDTLTDYTIDFENIPDTLKRLDQWVVYGQRQQQGVMQYRKDGKLEKTPYNADTHDMAQTNNPDTWRDFQTARETFEAGWYNGIGFVFTAKNDLVGIDIDHCLSESGELSDKAKNILQKFPGCYVETSPSGDGLHIWTKGHLDKGRKHDGVEIYGNGRYFTVTGKHWPDSGLDIMPCQESIEWLLAEHFPEKDNSRKNKENPEKSAKPEMFPAIHQNLFDFLERARHDAVFKSLWRGDTTGYSSHSEADFALRCKLAYYTQGNQEEMDALFRQSGLIRDKWDETRGNASYGELTLQKALESVTTFHSGQPKIFGRSDMSNAERLMNRHGQDIRYCHAEGQWYVWNGRYWEQDRQDKVMRHAKSVARSIREEVEALEAQARDTEAESQKARLQKEAARLATWAGTSENHTRLAAMLKVAQSDVAILPESFDANPWLLNCENGTIDLQTGILSPHCREQYHSKMVPASYLPEAACPTWERFLAKIFDEDEELIAFVQRAVGYSLTGGIQEQCIFILYGAGSNGKSTFVDTLLYLLASYGKVGAPDLLLAKQQTHPTELADLEGARFVSCVETAKGRKLDENKVKQMTGDSRQNARKLYQDFREFTNQAKLWLATNHKPQIEGNDHAIWRRIMLIPFEVTIHDHEKDKALLSKLKAEAAGILAWAVRGCLAWRKQGSLAAPDSVRDAVEEYRDEQDVLAEFISECCISDDSAKVAVSDLHARYVEWCQQRRFRPDNIRSFGTSLTHAGYPAKKSGGVNYRQGICLKID